MQRQVTHQRGPSLETSLDTEERCPECGSEIDGIAATGSGHRFVGCGHEARSVPIQADSPSLVGLTIE